MTSRFYCFAPLDLLDQFLAQGWTLDRGRPSHHDAWSATVRFDGPGEPPPVPRREGERVGLTGARAAFADADEGDGE